jgi:hypothetical protein
LATECLRVRDAVICEIEHRFIFAGNGHTERCRKGTVAGVSHEEQGFAHVVGEMVDPV